MPQGESFWNPYRWVPASEEPIARNAPSYRHEFAGISGRFDCTLEALTPLLVGDGKEPARFVGLAEYIRNPRGGSLPTVPGTSLKGAIRSLAELVGNAATPLEGRLIDHEHQSDNAQSTERGSWQLDVVARTFGYMGRGRDARHFAGLVNFSDAPMVESPLDPRKWPDYKVASGRPKPDHRAFYPTNKARKFYHHRPGALDLARPPGEIPRGYRGTKHVVPASPGTTFHFRVDFENLRSEDLSLLTYCLVLEDRVEVTLSASALGSEEPESFTLRGPLRHKLGGAKPLGGGSVHIRADRLDLREDHAAFYRGRRETALTLEGEPLRKKLNELIAPHVGRHDTTMTHLRAMLIYAEGDPRAADLRYPSKWWFDENGNVPLKPVLGDNSSDAARD
jgi:hypothetical protein